MASNSKRTLWSAVVAASLVTLVIARPSLAAYELLRGDFEYADSYGVCPGWTSYDSGHTGTKTYAKETSIKNGGLASQRVRYQSPPANSYHGVRQQIDCSVGDAFTFEGYFYNSAASGYMDTSIRVQWDGSTAAPSSALVTCTAKTTWTKLGPSGTAGNASSTKVTLFLHSRRTSSQADQIAYFDDVVAYHAYVPAAPTVDNPTASTLDVTVNPNANDPGDPRQYAIQETSTGLYVQTSDGSLGATADWATLTGWGTGGKKTVTGLSAATPYTFKVKSRYSGTITRETSFGATASETTSSGSTATKLAYMSVPTSGNVGVSFDVTVQSQDSGGVATNVTSNTLISLTVASGSGALGGTTTGTILSGQNSVTIPGVTYDTADTMTMTATASGGDSLTPVTSGNITFTAPPQTLHWGPNDANWTAANVWYNPSTSSAATYNDSAPDSVVLEDTDSGSGDRAITLNDTVSPGSVSMTASKNFAVSGSGVIDGAATLTVSGTGTLTLGTPNTYSGATTVSTGTLRLGAADVIPDGSGKGDVTVNGTLDLNTYSETINGLSGSGIVDNTASGTPTLTVGGNNASSTWAGTIQNTAGTLAFIKIGTGTLTWGTGSTPASTYSGNTTISAGEVVVYDGGSFPAHGAGKGNLTLDASTKLTFGQNITITANGLSGTGTITANASYDAPTIEIGDGDASSTFSGLIEKGSAKKLCVRKIGEGKLTLDTVNTFNGVCDVRAGTLEINSIADKDSSSAIGTGGYSNADARIGLGLAGTTGTLRYIGSGHSSNRPFYGWGTYADSGGGAVIDASGTGPLTLSGQFVQGVTMTANKALTLTGENTDANTFTGVINDGTGGFHNALIKSGGGKWVLGGTNLYTGGTTISGGTLEISATGSIKGNVTITGSVLRLDNSSSLESTATLTLPASPSAGTVDLNYSGTMTISTLKFGTVTKAKGTWGASGSGADHEDAAFTGTGILNVTSGSATTLSPITAVCDGDESSMTATVTGSSPTGTVQFYDGESALGDPVTLVDGSAALSTVLSVGTHDITAQYSGDDNDDPSTSGVEEAVVTAKNTYYHDGDADTYGDPADSVQACSPPEGYVTDNTDCDDADADKNPGETEVCDGKDNDCDTTVDEDTTGAACDTGQPGICAAGTTTCTDGVPGCSQTNPATDETCNSLDDDCDGTVDNIVVTVTDSPDDVNALPDTTAIFTAVASGPGTLSYQWQRADLDTTAWANISTGGRYTIADGQLSVSTADPNSDEAQGRYRCQVSGACGTPVESSPADLTIAPQAIQWYSIVTEGTTPCAVAMDPAKTGTGGESPFIEPRRGDIRIRVVFDKAVQAVDGSFTDKNDVSIASLLYNGVDPPISGSETPASVAQVDDTTLDIVLTSTPYSGEGAYPLDQKRLTVELVSNAIRRPGSTKAVIAGDRTCQIRCLIGDVNQTGSVNTTDIAAVRGKINAGFSPETWLYDVNSSGAINIVDMALVRNRVENEVP